MKIIIFYLFSLLLTIEGRAAIILLDPGHGGEDVGATNKMKDGSLLREKDLVLELAKEIKHQLSFYQHQVYLTRNRDEFIKLDERALMADKLNADIYISIHLNSSPKKSSRGHEIYYANSQSNKAISHLESLENMQFGEHDKEIDMVIADIILQKTAPYSKRLAAFVDAELNLKENKKRGPLKGLLNRGIKSALFYVLLLSKRPAILLEVAFLSNKNDQKKILQKSFQKEYAQKVASGIHKYLLSEEESLIASRQK